MKLTKQEQKVFDLIDQGVSGKFQIMQRLNLSYQGITVIIENLCRKKAILATASGYMKWEIVYPLESE